MHHSVRAIITFQHGLLAAASSAKDQLRACDYPEAGGGGRCTIQYPAFLSSLQVEVSVS